MISKYSKFDYDGLKIEANYNPQVINCKKIKFTIGKETAEMDKSDLYNLLVLFANDKEMDKCLDIKSKEVIMIKKMVKVHTKEAIKAGGEVVFPIEYPLGADEYEDYIKKNKSAMMKEDEAKEELNK